MKQSDACRPPSCHDEAAWTPLQFARHSSRCILAYARGTLSSAWRIPAAIAIADQSPVTRWTAIFLTTCLLAACDRFLSIRDVNALGEQLHDSLVVVRGGVPSRPLTIPLSDLVVARLTDGTDALTIVAPDTLAFPVGRRVVVRGRIHAAVHFGLVRLGPVLFVSDFHPQHPRLGKE